MPNRCISPNTKSEFIGSRLLCEVFGRRRGGHAQGPSAIIGPSWTPGRKRTSSPQDGGSSSAVRMYGAHAASGIRVRRTIKRDPRSVRGPGRLARITCETVLPGAVGVHHPKVSDQVAIDDLGAVGGPLRPIVLPRRAGQLAEPRPVRVHHVDVELAALHDGEGDP